VTERQFKPVPATDQCESDLSLSEIVHQAIGAASVAWHPDGVFDDAFARSIADYVVRAVTSTVPAGPRNELRSKLKALLNAESAENGSNTPDHILADYLLASLDAFDAATAARESWYGVRHAPGQPNRTAGEPLTASGYCGACGRGGR
jgi:hypothetical protein